jgi:hypothetical protein
MSKICKGRYLKWSIQWMLIVRQHPIWSELPAELIHMISDYFVVPVKRCGCGRWEAVGWPGFAKKNLGFFACYHVEDHAEFHFVKIPCHRCNSPYGTVSAFDMNLCVPCYERKSRKGWIINPL